MLTLDADWHLADDELAVTYRLTNRHQTAAFAYTTPRTAARLERYPGTGYVLLSAGDTDVTLLLGSCDPPAGMQVFARVQPLATRISAGQTFAGAVRLPVPIPEWDAYRPPEDPGRSVSVYMLRLVVEYVLEPETYFRQETPDGGLWDAGGSPVRRTTATFVPDRRVAAVGRGQG